MIIRQGGVLDVLKASRLWLSMVNELAPDLKPNREWWRKYAASLFNNGSYFMFVAEDGGKLIGFVDFFLFPEPATGKVHCTGQHLYVSPEYRKSIISGKLYHAAIKHARSKGVTIFELFCFDNEKDGWIKKGYRSVRTLVRREFKEVRNV